MSDTPRTEAIRNEVKKRWVNAHGSIEYWRDLAQSYYESSRKLERELAEAQKDAARYQWLRKGLTMTEGRLKAWAKGDLLDAAIDEAMYEYFL